MIRRPFRTVVWLLCAAGALCACSGPNASTQAANASVAVSTVVPVRRVFHDHVQAWGTVMAAPHATRSMTLPYGARVVAVDVIQGQSVKRGEPLVTVRPDPAARRAYTQAVNGLKLARKKLEQTRQLVEQHLATRSQLDAAQSAVNDAQATLQSVKAQGGGKTKTTLKAPADGVIGSLNIQSGQEVTAGTPLLVFLPTNALVVSLDVLPEALPQLHVGQRVTVHSVYDDHATWEGTLRTLGHAVNPQTQKINIMVAFDHHPAVAAGSAVAASIATASFKAWAVPRDALQSDAKGDYVLQIEHGKAKRIKVTVRAPDGRTIGVTGALDPQAPVITLGSYEVASGDPVHAASSPAPARSGTVTQ
jgi:RND family efflux transporter MFP subunit